MLTKLQKLSLTMAFQAWLLLIVSFYTFLKLVVAVLFLLHFICKTSGPIKISNSIKRAYLWASAILNLDN